MNFVEENAQCIMFKYLKQWRLYRGLSQEQVGLILKKKHTTVGRWEKTGMIKPSDLLALSRLYCATESQLRAPPEEAELVARLDRIQEMLRKMDPETFDHYLAVGERLLPPKN